MSRIEIRFSGFGGQGIILAGYICGKAAAIYDNKNSSLVQSFGPEARGGACSAEVVISDEEIDYPHVSSPDITVIMSQEAFTKFGRDVPKGSILIVDPDLVKIDDAPIGVQTYHIPATRFAEELGKKIIANIVMLGFFTAKSGAVSEESMKKAIESSVPADTLELNLRAFQKGYDYGISGERR